MNLLYYVAIGTTIFFVLGLTCIMLYGMEKRIAARRLFQMTRARGPAPAIQIAPSPSDNATNIRPASSRSANRPSNWSTKLPLDLFKSPALKAKLVSAGYRNAQAADTFLAARFATPLVALILAACIPFHRGLLLVAMPSFGYLLPGILLGRRITAHRRKIRESLPDAIDLLVICVEAGLGMDQALHRISQELALRYPAITDEFVQLNLEQRAGKPRIQAWQAMAERLQVPEITSFLNMMIQTERFGTPIGRALSNFAETLREKRRQAAEEKAAKTAVKITLPLALFIFPSIFVVLLGPAVLQVMHNFPNLGK